MRMLAKGPDDGTVVIGRLHGPFGVRGWIRVESFTEVENDILSYQPWLIAGRELRVAESKPHGRGLVVRLDSIDDRDVAAELKGTDIVVSSALLPDPEEGAFYWRDLTGLDVVTPDGVSLGTVTALLETGANDVMVVDGERERLVPWIDDVVQSVDLASRQIVVDWDPDF